jgi:hypothetical protein
MVTSTERAVALPPVVGALDDGAVDEDPEQLTVPTTSAANSAERSVGVMQARGSKGGG